MTSSVLFGKRKVPGERGGCGELTGPKHQGRKAVEAARRELAAEVGGGAGMKPGCGGLGKKNEHQMRLKGGGGSALFMGANPLGVMAPRVVAGADFGTGVEEEPDQVMS